jgi:DNA-binding NarL/FixJ family response regulator
MASKSKPDYWRQRLFRNTFTYKGRRLKVRGWSVKIQVFGRRKTFALNSPDPAQAAAEACRIYKIIMAQGWAGVEDRRGRMTAAAIGIAASAGLLESANEDWRKRLIHRRHSESPPLHSNREFSVRIEHAGSACYFPLGTDDEDQAAAQARRIYETVFTRGWEAASLRFPRELTLALRWLDDPLAWTYVTLHSQPDDDLPLAAATPAASPSGLEVALIEPDAGISRALAACINRQAGFRCDAAYACAADALREAHHRRLDFVVANSVIAGEPGATCLETLQQIQTGLAGLLYSVFEDSDHLFMATPGGAVGYLLKRTASTQLFEPIAGATRPLTREQIATRVRGYFQRLAASLPAGPPSRELESLTPREREILALLSKGQLAKEIAHTLGISVWTVNGHVKNIFEKLNVHSRTEAVVKFLQK